MKNKNKSGISYIELIQTPKELSNIITDDKMLLVVSDKLEQNENLYNIPLKLTKLNSMDIYRTLCKYIISVLQNEYLQYYQSTIKWIKKDQAIPNDKLFSVWYNTIPQNYTIPELTIYIKKEKDNIPKLIIGELWTSVIHFIYIIPNDNLSLNDVNKLKDDTYFQKKISKLNEINLTLDKIINYNFSINYI